MNKFRLFAVTIAVVFCSILITYAMRPDLIKILPQYLVPKHAYTAVVGYLSESKKPIIKNFLIKRFVNEFHVNMSEAIIEDPYAYATFNDFFIRKLKPQLRPIAKADIVLPVDGLVSQIGLINEGQIIQAKGYDYTVEKLLNCSPQKANQFVNGKFATLYLSPKDYHRVHMPLDAELISMTYIPGSLFSVRKNVVELIPKLYVRNKRLVMSFKTAIGPMEMVMVGATLVGKIGTSWAGDLKESKQITHYDYRQKPIKIKQGEEIGYFKMGSTVIVLFANGDKVHWNKQLKPDSVIHYGEAMGSF